MVVDQQRTRLSDDITNDAHFNCCSYSKCTAKRKLFKPVPSSLNRQNSIYIYFWNDTYFFQPHPTPDSLIRLQINNSFLEILSTGLFHYKIIKVNPNYNFITITCKILQHVSAEIGPNQAIQNNRYKNTWKGNWNSKFWKVFLYSVLQHYGQFRSKYGAIHFKVTLIEISVVGTGCLPREESSRGVALNTHLHLASRLKKEYSYTSNPSLGLHGLF